jgi:MFS family permease
MTTGSEPAWREVLKPAVIVGALGYFVDIYDLTLFSILRIPSLTSLGYSGEQLIDFGLLLNNCQMIGMLAGGILFGILGDRKGRVELLFGSILLYSLANIANGFVHSMETYAFWRFVAGIGLAGELGGSITLVSETLSRENRGYGTALVATIGVMGAVVGAKLADLVDWRTSYFIGGGMGLGLLALRMSVAESGMFKHLKKAQAHVARGHFFFLFTDRKRFLRYLCCILIGIPSWYVVGILAQLAPEFSKALGIEGTIKGNMSILFVYLGITAGDLLSGLLSQWFRSRKKIVLGFLLFSIGAIACYFSSRGQPAWVFYLVIFFLGLGMGYWAVFVTIGAEQFGTNIRATVATTVPNFVRASLVPTTLAFTCLKQSWGLLPAAIAVGSASVGIALLALLGLEETFGKDLDYHEVP